MLSVQCCRDWQFFLIARLAGKKIVIPWLKRNLPRTHKFMQSQDYKIILLLRLFPFAHFDLCSLIFGALAFRVRHFVIFTFIGILPESFLIAHFAALHPDFLARYCVAITYLDRRAAHSCVDLGNVESACLSHYACLRHFIVSC